MGRKRGLDSTGKHYFLGIDIKLCQSLVGMFKEILIKIPTLPKKPG